MLSGKFSVIVPAYNESSHIEKNVLETVRVFSDFGLDYEIIVVDDGSPDDTYLQAILAKSLHPERVRVVRYDENHGKGNALMCGTSYASGDYVVFLDADMDLHPDQLPTFFEMMHVQGSDAAVGSKLHPLSNVNYPAKRRVYSACYYTLVKMLFGLPLRDTQTGLKVFKAELLRRVMPRLVVKRFAFDIELLSVAHRLGYSIIECPVTLRFQRQFGRLNMGDVANIFRDTLAIFYRMHIKRYYDRSPIFDLYDLIETLRAREIEHV
jgi:glycosyltransferase involved in cell wall biosynthesis